jgi:formylglycine-generating enzyme required for sulfatase activity
MGSTPEEIERHLSLRDGPNATRQKYWRDAINSEGPQQPTVLSQPFYLGMFEVTQAEYERVMGTNPASHQPTGKAKDLIAGIDTAHFPVEMVSWNDAIEFCNQLCQTENLKPRYFLASSRVNPLPGDGYHLPTEAQWEFACRAGATTPSWAGHDETGLSRVAWYYKNSGGRVHAVGELLTNPFGLYDMLGNVEESCDDG